MELKKNDLLLGQRVCVGHYHCVDPRCLCTSRGAIGKASTYTGGCIFVDDASDLAHIEHQLTLSGVETSIRFSGAGAAYQNVIAERNIRTIYDTAGVMMIHASIHSEEGTMAMDHAA
eukprot:13771326-Ditylum_brightwellii.AAC.1